MTCPQCNSGKTRLYIRATENKDVWGDTQVRECLDCEHRWPV